MTNGHELRQDPSPGCFVGIAIDEGTTLWRSDPRGQRLGNLDSTALHPGYELDSTALHPGYELGSAGLYPGYEPTIWLHPGYDFKQGR
jgi:hypothetical protein